MIKGIYADEAYQIDPEQWFTDYSTRGGLGVADKLFASIRLNYSSCMEFRLP